MFGRKNISLIVFLLCFLWPSAGYSARIKDMSSIKCLCQNQLFGYGLVVGLFGSGGNGGTTFTPHGLSYML